MRRDSCVFAGVLRGTGVYASVDKKRRVDHSTRPNDTSIIRAVKGVFLAIFDEIEHI